MNKKMLVMALALTASLLITAGASGQACSSGVNIVFNGVGSSAQANALAYAARVLATGTGAYNLVSSNAGAAVTDARPVINGTRGVSDSANPWWLIWDNSAVCNVYTYWTVDSGVGVKDFMAYEKFTNSSGKVYNSLAAAYGQITAASITSATENQVPGLPDTQDAQVGVAGSAFTTIITALNVTPETRVATGTVAPPKYCGNVGTASGTFLGAFQCYFNAGGTDIRPEDALYATTRGLTSYNGLNIAAGNALTKAGTTAPGQLTGLGYNTAFGANNPNGNTATGCTPSANVGCTIFDTFGQKKKFNVVNFKLSGTDPISGGTLPAYTSLSIGADPILVVVHNGTDFGSTSGGTYVYNDINKQVLAQVFSGWSQCTHDLLTSGASFTAPGSPIQVLHREPLSGTYNTFEFNGVRTLMGSANPLATIPPAPISEAFNGQEQFNNPASYPGGNGTSCAYVNDSGGIGRPQADCFNPMYLKLPTTQCTGTATNAAFRGRVIGTGEMIKVVKGGTNTGNGGAGDATNIDNGIGYAFWSYGNMDPLCSGTGGSTTCPGTGGVNGYLGHYLTVDAVDPLFATEGGQRDVTPNPAGAFNTPYCNLAASSPSCFAIPFTHIYDGKYPIWSMLRTVTFAPVSGKVATPIGVLNMVAEEEIQSGPTSSGGDGLSDFVPFLTGITGSASTGVWNGNLNLFVFREHYKQSGISPANGHVGCKTAAPTFTGIQLQGGNSKSATCLVDFGGDVGGSVITVQKDVDFDLDFSVEEYGQHQ